MTAIKRFKNLNTLVILMVGIWIQSSAALPAQENDEARDPTPQRVVGIEEIVITAERSFYLLRVQIENAKIAFYSTYNDFNDDKDYDVDCRKIKWTHTNIPEFDCWPQFFDDIVAEESHGFADGFITGNSYMPLSSVKNLKTLYRNRFNDLRSNIMKIANEHPEVADGLINLATLEGAYKKKRVECMKQPAFLFVLRFCP